MRLFHHSQKMPREHMKTIFRMEVISTPLPIRGQRTMRTHHIGVSIPSKVRQHRRKENNTMGQHHQEVSTLRKPLLLSNITGEAHTRIHAQLGRHQTLSLLSTLLSMHPAPGHHFKVDSLWAVSRQARTLATKDSHSTIPLEMISTI